MKRLLLLACLLVAWPASAETRFVAVDVYVSSTAPLAAWQVEFDDVNGVTTVVGVENGNSDAFTDVPFYDRGAVERGDAERVIIADFSLAAAKDLPSGRTRVTTLHLMVEGEPEFRTRLVVAATHGGVTIDAEVDIEISGGSDQ